MRLVFYAITIVVFVLILGCGPGATQQQPGSPTSNTTTDQVETMTGGTCLEPDDVNSPWLVGLDGTSRGTIARNVKRGLVLVKQGECGTFQMLPDCFVKDLQYEDIPADTIRPDAIEVSSRRQLQKKVPLAVAKYSAQMDDTERWSLDYVDAGEKSYAGSLPKVDWDNLRSSCRAATHYVYKVTRGAFQLSMVNDSERATEGNIGPADFKKRAERRKAEKSRDGDYSGCASSNDANVPACGGLIRMWVEQIPRELLAPGTVAPVNPSSGQEGPLKPWNADNSTGPSVNWGWINVTSNYKGIPVLIDGIERGKTPLKEWKESVGNHSITVSNRCVYQGSKNVVLKPGETSDVRIDLIPKEGALRLLTVDDNGKPVKASVYVGGKKIGDTDGTLKASVFKRNICDDGKELEVRATGYASAKKKLEVKERGYTDLKLDMKKASSTSTATVSASTNEVKQTGTNLYWLRCLVGQTWTESSWSCSGTKQKMKWKAAKSTCPSGYRLPTRQEFVDLLGGCGSDVRSGEYGYCNKCSASRNCSSIFPFDTHCYWSSSPDGGNFAWSANFISGYVGRDDVYNGYAVRCVRSGP